MNNESELHLVSHEVESPQSKARSRKLLRSRFTQGSIEEIGKQLDRIVGEALGQSPKMGIYELFKTVERELPGKLPAQVQEKSLQAVASIDTNTRKLGEKAMLLLNAKTLISVVDLYFMEGIDTQEDREEMLSNATVFVLEKLSNLSPNIRVSQQVHYAAREGVAEYLSQRDNMPETWARDPSKRRLIATRIKDKLIGGKEIIGKEGIKIMAEELSKETGINEKRLLEYLKYVKLLNEKIKKIDLNEDPTVYEVVRHKLKEDVGEVLETLTDREKRVINLRFGLEDGIEWTLEEVGREFDRNRERIRQIEARGLWKLRHPTRAKRLRDYQDDDRGQVMPIKYKESPSSAQLERRWGENLDNLSNPYSIEFFNVPNYVKKHLISSGIRGIGDFFGAASSELLDRWTGNPQDLIWTVKGVLDNLGVGEDSRAESDTRLLYHITDGILYKEVKSRWLDVSARKALYRKAYEELLSFFSLKNHKE